MAADPDDVLRQMGRRVAAARRARGWTQAELAEHRGVSVKYVQRIEAGGANLTVRSMVELANVLRIAVHELLTGPRSRQTRPGRPRAS